MFIDGGFYMCFYFSTGQIKVTKEIKNLELERKIDETKLAELVRRHTSCDFGEISTDMEKANIEAILTEQDVTSIYNIGNNIKVKVITDSHRNSTTVSMQWE